MDSSFFQEIRFLVSDLFLTFERLFCYESFFSKYGEFVELHIKCITFNKYHVWEFDPIILYSVVEELDNLKERYPKLNQNWEEYLDQFKVLFLNIDDS